MLWIRFRRTLKSLKIFTLLATLSSFMEAHAYPPRIIRATFEGRHSYRSLGPEYYHPVKASKLRPTEFTLSLADAELAQSIGLGLKDLQRKLSGIFALETSPGGELDLFATFYNHGDDRPAGDGRAVWIGEIVIQKDDETYVYLDVSVKGPGPTGITGMDGRQSMKEALNSFVISRRNTIQGSRSTRDLAVFKLTELKDGQPAALSVRIGNQLRPATLGYYAQNVERSHKMFDYFTKRGLGLSPEEVVTMEHRRRFVERYIVYLAEEGAIQKNSHFFHGMLHDSNVNGLGGSIDFGTSRQMYIDFDTELYPHAVHTEIFAYYAGLIDPDRPASGTFIKKYLSGVNLKPNPQLFAQSSEFFGRSYTLEGLNEIYKRVYEDTLAKLYLVRTGLSAKSIMSLSPQQIRDFFHSARKIADTRWDIDLLLRDLSSLVNQENREEKALELLYSSRVYGPGMLTSMKSPMNLRGNLGQQIGLLFSSVEPVFRGITAKKMKAIENRAAKIFPRRRVSAALSRYADPFDEPRLAKVYDDILDGKTTYESNSRAVMKAVSETSHHVIVPESILTVKHEIFCQKFVIPET